MLRPVLLMDGFKPQCAGRVGVEAAASWSVARCGGWRWLQPYKSTVHSREVAFDAQRWLTPPQTSVLSRCRRAAALGASVPAAAQLGLPRSSTGTSRSRSWGT